MWMIHRLSPSRDVVGGLAAFKLCHKVLSQHASGKHRENCTGTAAAVATFSKNTTLKACVVNHGPLDFN